MWVPSLLIISVAAAELANEKHIRSNSPRRRPHINNSRLSLLRWGEVRKNQSQKPDLKYLIHKINLTAHIGFDFKLPSRCLPRIVSIKGEFAKDGKLSFHEQGRERKRPVNEVELIQ